jgi:hypothetical protein
MSIGFAHAVDANHLSLSLVGGGRVVQLSSGKVVTSEADPLFIYNWTFGVRLRLDLEAVTAAFRAAGRPYAHVVAGPSSRRDLPGILAEHGFRHVESQSYRRAEGTGAGAPGLVPYDRDEADRFADLVTDDQNDPVRREAYVRRFADPRTRPFRDAADTGCFLLFDDGPTTQLCHLAVRKDARGHGVGQELLRLATGLVPPGRPLWLFSARDEAGDRTAQAAGWRRDHEAENWLLDIDAGGPER